MKLSTVRRIIQEAIRDMYEEPSYEMDDIDLEDYDEAEEAYEAELYNDVEPYKGEEPKVKFGNKSDIPVSSPFNSRLGSNGVTFKKGESVKWDSVTSPLKVKDADYLAGRRPQKEYVVYHGKVLGQMGSIVRVAVDTFEMRGTLMRSNDINIQYIISTKLKKDANPPSVTSAKLTK